MGKADTIEAGEIFYHMFGTMVGAQRRALCISQDQLAEMVNVSRGTIVNVEKGKNATTLITGLDLCRALQIPMEEVRKIHIACRLEAELKGYPEEIQELVASTLTKSELKEKGP